MKHPTSVLFTFALGVFLAAGQGAPPPSAAPAPALAPDTPGQVLEKIPGQLRKTTALLLEDHRGFAPPGTLADWLGAGPPQRACDQEKWSNAPATGDLPIVWIREAGRYELSKDGWNRAGPSARLFTHYYLRAYDRLSPELRKSHSAAAVGSAALIAADILYPTNFAILPDDVSSPAEVVALLEALNPGVLAAVAGGKNAMDAVSSALAQACRVGQNRSVPDGFATAEDVLGKPWERAAKGSPLRLGDILPSHPLALQNAREKAASIPHLTLRFAALAAVGQARYTRLPAGEEMLAGWRSLADAASSALKQELALRKAASFAPAWTPENRAHAGGDPHVARPLAVLVLAPAMPEVVNEWRTVSSASALTKLRGHAAFREFCDLAGQEPEVRMAPKPKPDQRGSVEMGLMVFKHLCRAEPPSGGLPGLEEVSIDLIGVVPTGDGEPVRGFSADAFVRVLPPGEKEPRWIVAGEVVAGMKVLGHAPMAAPGPGLATRTEAIRTEWFTVSAVQRFDSVKPTALVGFENGWSLAVAVPQHLLVRAGRVALWVEALGLDGGVEAFVHDSLGSAPKVRAVQEHKTPHTLVSLSLTHEDDELSKHANNVVVAREASGGGGVATVECSPGDVSMVDEVEEVTTTTGRVALKALVDNPGANPNPAASVVSTYLEKPAGDPWSYKPFTPGESYVDLRNTGNLSLAVQLVVAGKDGVERPILCSRTTRLLAVVNKGRIVSRRAFNCKAGEILVADFAPDGKTPVTARVTRVEEVEFPTQRFVSLTLANLKLAKCGPLMVEWRAQPYHMFNMGVGDATALSLAEKTAGAAGGAAEPGTKVGSAVPVAKVGASPLAVYDPSLETLSPSRLAGTKNSVITRMLEVTAGKHTLRVAGSQALLARRKDPEPGTSSEVLLAYQIMPGDAVYVAETGATAAKPVEVDNVVPVFKCGLKVSELLSSATAGWHQNLPVRSDVCLGENLAVVMMSAQKNRKAEEVSVLEPFQDQPGSGRGSFKGKRDGVTPITKDGKTGPLAELDRDPANWLDFGKAAAELFAGRTRLIQQTLEEELPRARTVGSSDRLKLLEGALGARDWPFQAEAGALQGTLKTWVDYALQGRATYLKAPTWSELPDLLLQNIVLAAWLDEAGCPKTAQLFTRDTVELSLFAGTSRVAARDPGVNIASGIGMALAAGKWAVGQNSPAQSTHSVSPLASLQLVDWANGLSLKDDAGNPLPIQAPVPKDGEIVLGDVYTIWAILAEQSDIDWPDLTQPSGAGAQALRAWLGKHAPKVPSAAGGSETRKPTDLLPKAPSMPLPPRLLSRLLLGLGLTALAARAEYNPRLRLNYALSQGNASILPSEETLAALAAGAEGEPARQLIRHYLKKDWLDGKGADSPGLDLLDRAGRPLGALSAGGGQPYSGLAGMVAGHGNLPGAYRHALFVDWLRKNLPPGAVEGTLLPVFGKARNGTAGVVENLRFLQSLATTEEMEGAVSRHFDSAYFSRADVPEAATYFKALRLVPRPNWSAKRTLLADLFYGKPVGEWSGAGETLLPMTKESAKGTLGFLGKAAGHLRETPRDRAPGAAEVLSVLVRAVSSGEALPPLGLGEADCALEWFLWCHTQQKMIAHLLDDEAAGKALLARLVAFCAPVDDRVFDQLFPLIEAEYYSRPGLREEVFAKLLAPKARAEGDGAGRVLGAALRGSWTADHRHELGLILLVDRPSESPAWKGEQRTRLDAADEVYRQLKDEDQHLHVNRPLLEQVLNRHLDRFVRANDAGDGAAEEKAEVGIKPLVDHLRECRDDGADVSRSEPLRRIQERLVKMVMEFLDRLAPAAEATPPAPVVSGADNREVIRRFARRFKLALRINRLLAPADNREAPAWVKTLCGEMRTHVFGLPSEWDSAFALQAGGPVLRWEPSMLAFRSTLLADLALDRDFKEVLRESGLDDMVFAEVLIPLARVAGLVGSYEAGEESPYEVWCKNTTARYGLLFQAFDTKESLESDPAVQRLAVAHLGAAGAKTPWHAEPAWFFTGRWGVNAHFRLFKSILTAERPPSEGVANQEVKLPGLARLAHDRWAALPPALAMPHAAWVVHLVTAAEWQTCPFLTPDKAEIPWRDCVDPEGSPEEPFHFVFPHSSRYGTRRVDGSLRRQFTQTLLDFAGEKPEEPVLTLLATSAMLLPNSPANDGKDGDGTRDDGIKVRAAGLVNAGLRGATTGREALLRAYMRLGASLSRPSGARTDEQGGFPSELPPPTRYLYDTNTVDVLWMAGLREEFRRLLLSRESNPGMTPDELVRRDVDDILGTAEKDGTLLPSTWTAQDPLLRARDFKARLLQLGERELRDFLRLRRSMVSLLGLPNPDPGVPGEEAAPAEARAPAPPTLADAGRLRRYLGYLDWMIFYTRPDWRENHGYLAHRVETPEVWWPALPLLCAATPELQEATVRFTSVCPPGLAAELLTDLFRLNEAAAGVLMALAPDPKTCGRVLAFSHKLDWDELDLRLLALARHHDRADARTLASGAFAGVARNLSLLPRLRQKPDDAAMEGTLFLSLDSFLPEDARRRTPVAGLDALVAMAAGCVERKDAPAGLRAAASLLLESGVASEGEGLLQGAATAGKVIEVLFRLHAKVGGNPSPAYRGFYERNLTRGGRLGPAPYRALARPFFSGAPASQREDLSSFVSAWRTAAASPAPAHPGDLAAVCRVQGGPLFNRLLRGKGREPAERPYLWKPVESLAEAPLDPPPEEFLALTAWLQGLWREEDPPAVRAFFDPLRAPAPNPAPAPAAAPSARVGAGGPAAKGGRT